MKRNINTECPKCGGFAELKYTNEYGMNKLRLTCGECSYMWYETPLDSAEEDLK